MIKIEFSGYVTNIPEKNTANVRHIIGKHLRHAFLEITKEVETSEFDALLDASWYDYIKQLYHVEKDGQLLRPFQNLPESPINRPATYTRGQALKKARLFDGKIKRADD